MVGSGLKFIQFFGLDSRFQGNINEALNLLASAIENASEKAHDSCVKDKDATKAVKLLRYKKIIELLGLEGKSGLSEAKIPGTLAPLELIA